MPRTRRPAPMPAAQFPTGLPYGRQQALQQQAAALPRQAPAAAPQPDPRQRQQALAAAMGRLPVMPPLNAPSMRPHEPITAGLPVGAGAGPEALAQIGPETLSTADLLARLAQVTGDPVLAQAAGSARGWR